MKTFVELRTGLITELLAITLVSPALMVSAQIQSASVSASSDYTVVQRSPDAKIWQRPVLQTNQSGVIRTNIQSYTELATGISYLQDGKYVDSVEEVDPIPGGAQAIQGRHKVQWAANGNTTGGSVIVSTPDGKTLSSTVFGLAYGDLASGSNAAIAQAQDSTGAIVAPNQVVYANAFSNLTADIQYTYTKAGLSQDIVLDQAPPAPDRFGLSDETTMLQVYTEFFNAPEPGMTVVTNANTEDDQILDFGEMKMGVGQTFFLNGQDPPASAGAVTKKWVHINGRTFLIEAIPYSAISNQLQQLPQAMNVNVHQGSIDRTALLEASPTRSRGSFKMDNPMKLSKLKNTQPRLMMDYNLFSSSTLTLQGDTTYLVSGVVNISGNLTVEGGAVIKYTNTGAGEIVISSYFQDIVCQTAAYRPAVFTSMNDNSVGTVIPGSTGTPTVTSTYISFSLQSTQTCILRNLRFSYATTAISGTVYNGGYDSDSITIWDCQFFDCSYAFDCKVTIEAVMLYVYNSLFSGGSTAIEKASGSDGTLSATAVNVTADGMFAYEAGLDSSSGVNSIFTRCYPSPNLTNCYTSVYSSNGVYQTVGAASYYLAPGSTNRGWGTTNINASLLTDLETLTTYPPVTFASYWLTNDYTFFPQAQRDNSGSTVDLGYHYDPIDYAIVIQISNATATVLPGTVLSSSSAEIVWLYENATLNCNGTATSPAYLVRYNTVQEQSNTNWINTNQYHSCYATPANSLWSASSTFRFTDWSVLAGDGQYFAEDTTNYVHSLQDCQFYNGAIAVDSGQLFGTNNLFQRVNFYLSDNGYDLTDTFYNNLFWNGELNVDHYGSLIWTFRDNLFDHTAITQMDDDIDVCSNNAYVTTNDGYLTPTNAWVILSSSPGYQSGDLGDYYYPTSLTQLIHKGSQSAPNAGLYHYTVLTNDTIEGTNTVSIGFHYVACANGVPIDTNGDGIPDYLEDINGNGLVDSGEIGWNIVGDLGLAVVITQPANNSKIP